MVVAEFVDFSAQRVAMNPQSLRRLRSVIVALLQHLSNEPLLELADGVFVSDPMFNHLVDKGFKLVFHGNPPNAKWR
jgi:hypothetical protein